MQVKVTLVIEVNPDIWDQTYGPSVPIREDVREYVLNQVAGSTAAEEGAIDHVRVVRHDSEETQKGS